MNTIKPSKSRFVAGCQCLKRLYWQVHEPELAAEPDAATEAIIQQGREARFSLVWFGEHRELSLRHHSCDR